MSRARAATDRRLPVAATAVVGLTVATLCAVALADHRLVQLGRTDLRNPGALIYLVALVSASAVGAVLLVRQPQNRAGWCFAALGASMAVSGLLDGYAAVGAIADPGSLPFADAVAVLGDASFIPWIVLLSLALHLTPTGRPLSPRWVLVARTTVAAGVVWWLAILVSGAPLDAPFDGVRNPLSVTSLSGGIQVVRALAGALTGIGLLLAGLSLLIRFRRSRGLERRQLRWLALAVIPLPLFLGLSFVAATTGRPLLLVLATSGFVAVIPVAAGLAIGKYHLYDVDRVLSRATTYVLLTLAVLAAYVATVVVLDRALHGLTTGDRATASAAVAALAVAIAAPGRARLQDAVDRRFSRRRFAALEVVRAHARDPQPGVGMDTVLRRALGDPSASIAYWIAPEEQWVTADGLPPNGLADNALVISRHGQPVARISFDRDRCEPELVSAVADEALPGLENTGLRAALALELVKVQASRARIADAHRMERQRIERDLHDGAQQRLLALAMQLRAALVNGDAARLEEAVRTGVDETQTAVRELRELANGLHPAALADGGLSAAIDDLARRVPGPLELHVPEQRYPQAVEGTAWFIVCEAVTNAMKHARDAHVRIDVQRLGGCVLVRVTDDGPGIADPSGRGLRGLADRAAAVGGQLRVRSSSGGTTVEAELPCES